MPRGPSAEYFIIAPPKKTAFTSSSRYDDDEEDDNAVSGKRKVSKEPELKMPELPQYLYVSTACRFSFGFILFNPHAITL